MAKKTFYVNWVTECEIELDEEVLTRVDDEWRAALYDLRNDSDIAEHIAFNLVVNRVALSDLDGWADMQDNQAKVIAEERYDWTVEDISDVRGAK